METKSVLEELDSMPKKLIGIKMVKDQGTKMETKKQR